MSATHFETSNGDVYCTVNQEWSETSDASLHTSADGAEAEGEVCLSCYNLVEDIELVHHQYVEDEYFCDGKLTGTYKMYRMDWAENHVPVQCDACHEVVDA